MTKHKNPERRNATAATELVTAKEISEIQKLRAEELSFAAHAQRNRVEERCRACRIGEIIQEKLCEASHGANVIGEFARKCGLSQQAIYDYLHLYRGAMCELAIRQLPDLSREYWQAIGSAINPKDVSGMFLRADVLKYPIFKDGGDPDNRKPNPDKVLELGDLLRKFRETIKGLGMSYAFEEYTIAAPDDAPPPARTDYTRFSIHTPECVYWFMHRDSDEQKMDRAFAEFQTLLDGAMDVLGIGKPAVSVKSVLFKRDRQQKIDSANANATPNGKAAVDSKLFFGRCEDVLLDETKFPPRSIDVCVTDPPYSKEYYKAWRDDVEVDHDAEKTLEEQVALVGKVFKILAEQKIIKERFIAFIFFPMDYVHLLVPPVLDAFKGLDVSHQVLVWDKERCPKPGGHKTFGRQAEAILYVNVGDKHLSEIQEGDKTRQYPPSLFQGFRAENKTPEGRWKPAALLERLVMLSTTEKDREKQVVLDMFVGSGATGLAAIKCGADFRAVECHQEQYQLAKANILTALNAGD